MRNSEYALFRVMPIQREWHYIDRQEPHVLSLSLIGPIIVEVLLLTTIGKTGHHLRFLEID